jgi:cytoskeletal protein CcmA (bactofilin family)
MDQDRATLIDAHAEVEGSLRGKDAHVLGRFKGEIKTSGRLLLGEGSLVEGRVEADIAELSGSFKGDIVARSVKLGEKARVEGTIEAVQLSVREGAIIDGRVAVGEAAAKAIARPAPAPIPTPVRPPTVPADKDKKDDQAGAVPKTGEEAKKEEKPAE